MPTVRRSSATFSRALVLRRYYSYLWPTSLTATVQAFKEARAYDTKSCARLKKDYFQVGDTMDPAPPPHLRGHDRNPPLMRKRGALAKGKRSDRAYFLRSFSGFAA